jgi:acetamidase/formamidase
MAIHTFTPTHYHSTLGEHPPVLFVQDGDSIVTSTVDARGGNYLNEIVATGSNPQTGPFFIKGAVPGDALKITLEHLAPNRRTGWSRMAVAANVVDPEYIIKLPRNENGTPIFSEWEFDIPAWTTTLSSPETGLGRWTLPLQPMLGCFGVAPGKQQAISTSTSGSYGGNMDYRGFTIGSIAYFPINVEGALFFLGDGHAVQGDGEIVGTGIETSFEVRFSVQVIKNWKIGWPRGENYDYIFTVGNARPLDQCVQHATSEMLKWLIKDYHLDPLAANLLLGQCVEYDLGNMFDPAYTMVCKVPKKYLPLI